MTSTVEAEYISFSHIAIECICISRMTSFAIGSITMPISPICVDNQDAIKMDRDDASGNRARHIEIKHHLIRSCVSEKKLVLQYCPTENIVGDILTKPLSKIAFQKCIKGMGVG